MSSRSGLPSTVIRRLVPLAIPLLAFPCCQPQQDGPQAGSESHFLKHCSTDCDDGLACLLGVCTKSCVVNDECTGLGAGARCMAVPGASSNGGDAGSVSATCEMPCVTAAECAPLGARYRCEAGFCRAGEAVCSATTLPSGSTTRSIVVGDLERSYVVQLPAAYTGTAPVPLVLDFHPMNIGTRWEMDNSGYRELAEQEGFIVAWPQGTETSWNLGPCCTKSRTVDDYAFARAVVRQLSTEACIDPQRIYAAGFSMGAGMAYYLGCTAAEVFAAVAASSMDLLPETDLACAPSRPITEISFRATNDAVVPYGGGPSFPPGRPEFTTTLLGAEGTFQRWAELNQCTGAPREADGNGCSTYSSCEAGVEVTLCKSTGQPAGQVMGDARISWDMLKRHPMP